MIAIIGATGNVGKELVEQLCALGQKPRIVTRDERKVAYLGDKVDRVIGDAKDRAVLQRALAGADKLFCLTFPDEPETFNAIVDEAKRAGVRHVVLLSSIGASSPSALGRHHREREEIVEAAGFQWTFLRPGYFCSNVLRWAQTIKSDGRVMTPTPDGKVAPISPRDIAEMAAIALTRPGHEGKSYDLTGEEMLSQRYQTDILSRVLGKPIDCVAVSFDESADSLRTLGRPEWLIDSLVGMWAAIRDGKASRATGTFAKVAGHPPESFEAWSQANRAAFS